MLEQVQEKAALMSSSPSPGEPIMLDAGTRTSLNSTTGEFVARWPIVSIMPVISTPGAPASTTMTANDSDEGRDMSVRTMTLIRSAPRSSHPEALVV